MLRLTFASTCLAIFANAQNPPGAPILTYIPGSSAKVEQLIGDTDYQTNKPTASQTATRYNILGNDIGFSFEDNGKLFISFGDTIGVNAKYQAHDPIATSTATDPEAGLLLNFFTNPDGTPLFVEPPGVAMGADDVPNSGISLPDGIYFICNTGADTSLANPHTNDVSLLAHFDETTRVFTTGRTVSKMPDGHFIITAPHVSGSNVFMWGAGAYRASDIYLSMTPTATFASGAGTQYFAGLVNGQPTWTASESGAVPVVQDNPLNGPAWPNDSPTVGNIGVAWSNALNLWLMTYDGGRQSPATNGTYFTYAAQPWGPWATPQLIFNAVRDKGIGVFIHDPSIVPDPPGDGLNGPTIGANDIYTTRGGAYSPLIIERFVTVVGSVLKIYYTMSTWNPYTIVKMRSEFNITPAPVVNLVANAEGDSPTIAPNTWVEIKGLNLAPDTRIWKSSDFVNNQLPANLDGVNVTVNGKTAFVYYISPTQINILTPPDAMTGPLPVQVTNNGAIAASATAQAQALSPSFFVFNGGPYVAATRVNGALLGPASLYPGSSTPAKPGETVVLYANGFGPTSTPVISGSTTQSGSLSPLPVIKIGGLTAVVQFAGLVAPGQYQFNVVIPTGLANGDQAITASYGGQSTQAGTSITIQN
jgi:uncharacterized protein (TIGR03437 family)